MISWIRSYNSWQGRSSNLLYEETEAVEAGGVSEDKKVCAGPTPVPRSTLHAELSPLDSLKNQKEQKL